MIFKSKTYSDHKIQLGLLNSVQQIQIISVPLPLKVDFFVLVERMESCQFQTICGRRLRTLRAGGKVHF